MTRAFATTGTTAAVLLWSAVALHRPDLLVLGAPLAAALVLAGRRRPSAGVTLRVRPSARTAVEGQQVDLLATVEAPAEADLVDLRVSPGPALSGEQPVSRAMAARAHRTVALTVTARRWGRLDAGGALTVVSAAQGLLRWEADAAAGGVRVRPRHRPFRGTDVTPNPSGGVGAHRSRQIGDGIDLAGVRPFVAGDRLRRVNWPVSLRTGELHVTTTLTERDTAVMLVIDPTAELGRVENAAAGTVAEGGSIDTAVHAAAALAEHYLRLGDRVGLVDIARPDRPLRPDGGTAQQERLVEALLDVRPQPGTTAPLLASLVRRLAPRATVMLFSPLLGTAGPARAAELARAGASVLVVDTLPDRPPGDVTDDELADLAWRIVRLERRAAIDRLAALGVPVVGWRGDASLDVVLLAMARTAARPRMLR